MSDELSDFFALPPFKADEALVKLRRDLRELKSLQEQGSGATPARFALKGVTVIELQRAPEATAIQARVAKRPSPRPEWVVHTLGSSAEVRKWLDGVRLAVKRWDDED
ncbi:hypothetical protein WNB94_07355 [Aquabacterium sp. A3]|uniref:hypothetical protein n=1 Tax=Aquabacterium sp. A3 TaxID=3132829 RepID=UPI003119ED9C